MNAMQSLRARYDALSERRRFLVALVGIVLAAFVLRVAARALAGQASFWDQGYDFFFGFAQSIAEGKGYVDLHGPTAFRVPGYPLFLAAVTWGHRAFWPIVIAQSLVSAGTVACAGLLGRRLFGRSVGLIAATATALYPYYLWHDTAMQETGLFTFLTAASMVVLLALYRRRTLGLAVAGGVMLGLAILTRSTLAPFALVAILWLALPDEAATPARKRMVTALVCLFALSITLSPWLIRAHAVTGRFTLGTEFGGAVFYGNNPETFSFYPKASIDLSRARAEQSLTATDIAELDVVAGHPERISDWYLHKGLAYIAADPMRFVIGGIRKNLAAFGWLPSPRRGTAANLLEVVTFGPVMLLGLYGMWRFRRRWRVHLIFYAQFILFAGITAVLWGHSSHRSYLDVYWIVFGAGAVAALAARWFPALAIADEPDRA